MPFMKTKFLLIDDEPGAESYTAALAAAHNDLAIASVDARDPRQIEEFVVKTKPDGLLIDLQLTKSKGKAAEHFKIEGTALAQEFRTRSNNLSSLSIPMVSLSYSSRRETLVGRDTTASDLFDANLSKKDVRDHAREFAKQLVDLANGYRIIGKKTTFSPQRWAKILGLSAADYKSVDARIHRDLAAISGRPLHNIAGFFLHVLLPFSGPLIDEATLAIRLGVDRQKSGRGWGTLLSKLPSEARYRGVFSDSFSRWWMSPVDRWWQSARGAPALLAMLPAIERVEFLKKRFKQLNLTAVEQSVQSPDARFWVICERTGIPVDPPDGYAIADDEQMRTWHDKRYLSRKAALRYIQSYVFEPGEKGRLAKIRQYRRT